MKTLIPLKIINGNRFNFNFWKRKLLILIVITCTAPAYLFASAIYVNDIYIPGSDHYTLGTGSDLIGNGSKLLPYATIQKAISVASAGDTIYVDAGTYTLSSAIIVNVQIIILGSQAGVDARTRSSGSESIVDAVNVTGFPSTVFDVQPAASGSEINGFTLQGASGSQPVGAIYMEPGSNGTAVLNNIIQNNTAGIFLANNSGSNQSVIKQNLFRNNTAAGSASGNDIYADEFTAGSNLQNVLVSDNTFTNSSLVINSWGLGISNTGGTAFTNITFQNNQINNHGRGMYFFGASNCSVTGNTFTGTTNYGIGIFDGTISNSLLTITNNIFNNNKRGIWIDESYIDAYNGTLSPTGNSFTGNTYDLENSSVIHPNSIIDATNNTYDGTLLNGSTSTSDIFTIADKMLDEIDVSTFGKIILKPNNEYVTSNSYYTDGGTTTPSIQRGINAAGSGDIVNVSTGSFTEQLEVTQPLTVLGQGTGQTTVISPDVLTLSFTTSAVNKPIIFVHDASGVTVRNLTVDGAGKGNANNRFQGIAYWNAGGTVRDCEIKSIRNNPIDGVQAGVTIYASADDGNSRTLNVIKNNVYDFQKNGMTFVGEDLTANADSNTVTGAGPVDFIAQNGIQLSFSATGSVTNNNVSSVSYTPNTAVSCGILIFGTTNNITTSGNTVNNAQAGIYSIESSGTISANTVTYTASGMGATPYWYAIDQEDGTASITENTVSGGGNGTGIESDAFDGETTSVTASNNFVDNTYESFVIFSETGGTNTTAIHENSITNSVSLAIDNSGADNQDATCNWYGTTNSSAIAALLSGPLTYIPYLSNGSDNDAGTPGFQPLTICSGTCQLAISSISVTGATCAGGNDGQAMANVTGSSGIITYSWNTNPVQTTQTATGLSDGKRYTVTIADQSGCTAKDSALVGHQHEPPVATISPSDPQSACKGVAIMFTAGPSNSSYQWLKGGKPISGATDQTYTTSKGTANFKVIVTSTFGCKDTSAAVSVTRFPSPDPTVTVLNGGNLDLCQGQVKLKGPGGASFTWQWYKGSSPIAGATDRSYVVTTTGNYKVQVTNQYSCSKKSPPVTVTKSCREGELLVPAVAAQLSLYPNPSDGHFTIDLRLGESINEEATIQVVNMIGQVVMLDKATITDGSLLKEIQLDKDVAAGIYTIRISVDNNNYQGRILYQR